MKKLCLFLFLSLLSFSSWAGDGPMTEILQTAEDAQGPQLSHQDLASILRGSDLDLTTETSVFIMAQALKDRELSKMILELFEKLADEVSRDIKANLNNPGKRLEMIVELDLLTQALNVFGKDISSQTLADLAGDAELILSSFEQRFGEKYRLHQDRIRDELYHRRFMANFGENINRKFTIQLIPEETLDPAGDFWRHLEAILLHTINLSAAIVKKQGIHRSPISHEVIGLGRTLVDKTAWIVTWRGLNGVKARRNALAYFIMNEGAIPQDQLPPVTEWARQLMEEIKLDQRLHPRLVDKLKRVPLP